MCTAILFKPFENHEALDSKPVEIEGNIQKNTNLQPELITKYSTCYLNIREKIGEDAKIYDTVSPNTELHTITGFHIGTWLRVLYDDKELYVDGQYLSDKPPDISEEFIDE